MVMIKITCECSNTVPLVDLENFQGNLKAISKTEMDKLKKSILKYGFSFPVFIWKKNILDGHQRLAAVKQLVDDGHSIAEIPVVRIQAKNKKEAAEKLLLINSRYATIEQDGFEIFVKDFEIDIADVEMLIEIPEIDINIGGEDHYEGKTDPDDIPDVPDVPVSKLGDIWLLGDHRLMCGDSTVSANVSDLMQQEKSICCITDPPYSVNYKESHKIRGGDKKVHEPYKEADIDPSNILRFIGIIPSDLLILSYSVDRHIFVLCDILKKYKYKVRKELIWVKDTFSFWMGAAYQQKHEPIWVCSRNNRGFKDNVSSDQSTILNFDRPKRHKLHPTSKPIGLWEVLIRNHSNINEILYEPFSGSGTTIIASQKTGRRCFAMEISPQYVDVAVKRWEDFTGETAVLEST